MDYKDPKDFTDDEMVQALSNAAGIVGDLANNYMELPDPDEECEDKEIHEVDQVIMVLDEARRRYQKLTGAGNPKYTFQGEEHEVTA